MKKILLLLAAILVLSLVLFLIQRPPLLEELPFSRVIADRNGEWLRVSTTPEGRYRLRAKLEAVPTTLIEAALLYEDRYFYQHAGANPVALAKAAWSRLGGGRRFGASTLTMQVARLRYDLHTRTLAGKLEQILYALRLEIHYSKKEILDAYFNLAPYGGNVEGIEAASRIYLGKSALDLTKSEALTLAIVPQSPARRRLDQPNLESLNHAREVLSVLWRERHPEDAPFLATLTAPRATRRRLPNLEHAPHFCLRILNDRTSVSPVCVTTTLDLGLQTLLESNLTEWIETRRTEGISNAVALLVHAPTGEIRASVGSADFQNARILGQNDGTTMRRSVGSTLKPFVYGLALEAGLIHPHSLLTDAPRSFGEYNPENFERDFAGPIQATDALVRSRNLPAVELLQQLQSKPTTSLYSLLQQTGADPLQPAEHYGLTLALGSCELSPRHLASLYAMLANGGTWQPLQETLPSVPHSKLKTQNSKLLSPESAFLILDMLRQNPRPLHCGRSPGTDIAWKTGTSWSFKDAWCVGVFDDWVLVVWVGDFTGKSNPTFVGRKTAAPLFFRLTDAIRATSPSGKQHPEIPEESLHLARVDLCALTGDLASSHCAHTLKGWFIPGKSPLKICEVHQKICVNPLTGRRIPEYAATATTISKIMEVWPSEWRPLLARAGRCPPEPPEWEKTANVSDSAPEILSPPAHILRRENEPVSLLARGGRKDRPLRWFLDQTFLGSSTGDHPLLWEPRAGTHTLTVVDGDQTVTRRLTVE